MVWPKELVEDLARRRCVVFLGSGISANACNEKGEHLPTWKKFLEIGSEKVGDDKQKNVIKDKINKCDYLMACELIKKSLGEDSFDSLLKEQFSGSGFKPTEIHKHIYKLDSRIIITPNFDKIYDIYAQSTSEKTVAIKHYYDNDIVKYLRGKDYFIIKIHGTIDKTDQIIFTQADYATARIKNADFYKILESLILNYTFVFLGAGLKDPDIRILLENNAVTFHLSKNHYFVIPDSEEEYPSSELEVYKKLMHIEFVKYNSENNHKELIDGLKELAKCVDQEQGTVIDTKSW
ncbi:MAG: SIR2 family protein [Bacteroidaceae bacterium]|nr:SIR2 family protein [Bacteroidaceae bacterium]